MPWSLGLPVPVLWPEGAPSNLLPACPEGALLPFLSGVCFCTAQDYPRDLLHQNVAFPLAFWQIGGGRGGGWVGGVIPVVATLKATKFVSTSVASRYAQMYLLSRRGCCMPPPLPPHPPHPPHFWLASSW